MRVRYTCYFGKQVAGGKLFDWRAFRVLAPAFELDALASQQSWTQ